MKKLLLASIILASSGALDLVAYNANDVRVMFIFSPQQTEKYPNLSNLIFNLTRNSGHTTTVNELRDYLLKEADDLSQAKADGNPVAVRIEAILQDVTDLEQFIANDEKPDLKEKYKKQLMSAVASVRKTLSE